MASHRSSGLLFTAGLALWGGFMGEEKGGGGGGEGERRRALLRNCRAGTVGRIHG